MLISQAVASSRSLLADIETLMVALYPRDASIAVLVTDDQRRELRALLAALNEMVTDGNIVAIGEIIDAE